MYQYISTGFAAIAKEKTSKDESKDQVLIRTALSMEKSSRSHLQDFLCSFPSNPAFNGVNPSHLSSKPLSSLPALSFLLGSVPSLGVLPRDLRMDSAVMDPLMLEDFGQRVDLTRRIREVLVNYPEGTTVLKELIQNADDAGATRVCLCLDRRTHGRSSLLSDKLAEWQGPALLAHNNAVFTEDDFVSISRIGDSKKQTQAWKTGRFGVGFNSVYHLTDLPSFVSGKYVVLFDPQGVYLPNISASNPGKRLEYVSSSAISLYKDQFFPYCAFGCDMKSTFPGTLFRFPLRNAAQAAVSKLSRQAYSEDDISLMFSQLFEEAVFALLFLKNVISVEMYTWDASALEPQKLYSCSVHLPNEEIVWHRHALHRLSKPAELARMELDSFSLQFLSEEVVGTHSEKRVDTFFIVQAMAPETSRIGSFAAAAAREYDLHLLPWGAVAACISEMPSKVDILKQGRAFCFLPLPVRTGLTVHVNAYFEVSSNRRSIWFGADMDRGGKLRSDWNVLLLNDIVAPAFNRLLLGVQELTGASDSYFSLWPEGVFEEPWNILVEEFYKTMDNSPVLFSDINGGIWIPPAEAFFHDELFSKTKELAEALIQLGMPVVQLPSLLLEMFFKYASKTCQKVVSPFTVRSYLKGCETLVTVNRCHKLVLLEYCLQDLVDAEVGKHARGLPLLPLANGLFGLFSEVSKGELFFICNELEYQLLCAVSDKIIDRNIPADIYSRLSAIAKSSNSNITFLTVECFLELLPRFFPADWKYKDKVVWDPETFADHPKKSWFILFWLFLQDKCNDLSIFGDWPILPSTSGHLYRAAKTSKFIGTGPFSNTLKGLFNKIGCKMLNPAFGIEHPQLSLYVHNCNAAGVVDAIFDVSLNEDVLKLLIQDVDEDEKNELRCFLLDPKWYVGGILADSQVQKCKLLPIYKVYGGGRSSYASLEMSQKYLPPLSVPEYFLGDDFICNSSRTEEDILLRYYGVQRMSMSNFYKRKVLNRINELQPDVRDPIMLSILQDLPQLCMEDSSFRELLRKLEFVPTTSGSLKCPEVLYDPRNEELFALLEDSDSFPYNPFQEFGVLDMLQGLGLRTSVSPDTIIQSARQIESIMHTDQLKAQSRGRVLLSYLEVNATKWLINLHDDHNRTMNRMLTKVAIAFRSRDNSLKYDLEKFWYDLRMISWCPVLVSPPYLSLPWPTVSSTVAPPKLVRPQTDTWLVSGSMRLLDGDCSSTTLHCCLGWSSPPGGNVIAAQLLELGKNNETVIDQELRQELALAMPRIYAMLAGMIGDEEMDIVKVVLEGSRWIWVGDGFATLDEVVLNGPLHLAPYIRVIPVDLAVFRELFLELGVREYLKPADYAGILLRMAVKKDSIPLEPHELRAALLVVQHLAEVHFKDQNIPIYLPDASSTLFLATDLVFNDAPWLLNSEDEKNASGNVPIISLSAEKNAHKLVHSNISNDVAEKLGVCSIRRLLLAESADSMNLSLSGVAEAFGQHEALTTRLKHIVEMYADGPGILFELVQNADDAGASEVSFLLDKTQYGTSSVLSPEMADWQGPALYCFNSSVFSPQDLYSISRIGQDSKLDKPFAIGRFGLGFNCVYHFTDIPGFVSGEYIVMFDPHACNLPGISPTHPGLRIRFAGKRILDQFPDQFLPFLHFGCDLQHPFPGTLFRFPLRSENMALRSQIKKEKYAPEDVLSLFSSFAEVVSETLLFLRNVKTISIFVKDAGHEMQLLHRAVKRDVTEPKSGPQPLKPMFDFVHGNKQNALDKDQFFSKLSKLGDTDLPLNYEKIVVTEQSLSGEKTQLWIISECLGGGRARSKYIAADKNPNSFIPWASVAAYLQTSKSEGMEELTSGDGKTVETGCSNQRPLHFQIHPEFMQYRKDIEGRAFCFLPLPIYTGLPTHINAYFQLSSNRRDIWFGNDMAGGGKVRSDWNLYLLEDVAAPAYGHLLEKVAAEFGPCDLFFSLWPTTTRLEPWASMVRKLYKCISERGLRVLYTKARGGQWISTKQALFPDFAFPKSSALAEALSLSGLPLVEVSEQVMEIFMQSCPSLHYLTPRLLRNLLIRRKREFKDKESMVLALEYCLNDMTRSGSMDTLHGLPLIPLANGSFATFNMQGSGDKVFITNENEFDLLKGSVPHLLVDNGIPEIVLSKLKDIAESGSSNMSVLTCHFLEKLLPRILPAQWQYAKQVSWTPGHQGQPSFEWMALLWSYLKSSCPDLTVFSKWPILPLKNGDLMQLTDNSNVIRDGGWSESMSSLLQKLGFMFLRTDLQIEHPQLKAFLQEATATGILNVLLVFSEQGTDIPRLFDDVSEGEKHELRSFIFQSKWFQGNQIDIRHIELIKILPIFESYKSRKLTSLNQPVKMLRPEGVHEDLLDENFVFTRSERERSILGKFLEIREPLKADFYRNSVLNCMPQFLSQPSLLSAILLEVKLLVEEDSSIKSVLGQIPFVQTVNGSWQHPSRLYDPRIPGLQEWLHKEAFFPSDNFSNNETLDILVSLGLRKILGFSGLLDCARSISMMHDLGNPEVHGYARRLLLCLDALAIKFFNKEKREERIFLTDNHMLPPDDNCSWKNPELSCYSDLGGREMDMTFSSCLGIEIGNQPEEEFWSELKSISWCPVYVDPPQEGLPWCLVQCKVASPCIVRPKSQMWMVSSMMHILDGECFSEYLQSKLGWLDSTGINVLSNQLVELSNSYFQLKSQSQQDSLFDATLQKEIPNLYSKIQEFVGTDDLKNLKSAVEGVPCIWIGDTFVEPKILAFDAPVKFPPYLYVVPSELSEFRVLLTVLGVKLTFDTMDYLHVLQHLRDDLQGLPLSPDQLSFVHCILEALAECSTENSLPESCLSSLFIPDSSGILIPSVDIVYNDAPWMEKSSAAAKHFVHPSISYELAEKLGVQSLRFFSLVDEELTKDLPCMDYVKINELLTLYGGDEFLLFDLLELADCCKATKLVVVFDKRNHPRQSMLQYNLGEFQGPALTVVLEGAALTREEICSLQFNPPWKLRGTTINYGLGLLSCFAICNLLSVVSSGYFYIFDPLGLALSVPSGRVPSAKMFSLTGTNLIDRFHDQFHPMFITLNNPSLPSNSTIIRMPLSSALVAEGLESGFRKVNEILGSFMEHAAKALLFLKSVVQVTLSTWEEEDMQPRENCVVCIDPSSAVLRNPFSEKKWRKFQISRFFSSSCAAMKLHPIDIHIFQGGARIVDKWFVVLSLGSGQTRNMALDRRYLAYNLSPFAGVAAHISRNGEPAPICSTSRIMSPLPISGDIALPVMALGCFVVCHNGGRYLFNDQSNKDLPFVHQINGGNQLIEAWNKELMLCIRDSYIEMVLEFQKLRREPSNSGMEPNLVRAVSPIFQAYGDKIYSFWPKSNLQHISLVPSDEDIRNSNLSTLLDIEGKCLIEQVIKPFYTRLVDLPVWQLYSGNMVKAEEGMFLSQSGSVAGDNFPPATVCSFIKEHYPVFSVPWELVSEIQAVGITVREIKPKMVRDLLKASSASVVLRSVESYVDVLEYCLRDILLPESTDLPVVDALGEHDVRTGLVNEINFSGARNVHLSREGTAVNPNVQRTQPGYNQGPDALEMMTSFGRALFEFGRGVVEDIGRSGGPSIHITNGSPATDADWLLQSIIAQVKGLPCPTATKNLARLGFTELWLGSKEQQLLMVPLAAKFIHSDCFQKPILSDFFSNQSIQACLKLQNFSLYLLSSHLRLLFSEHWVNHVMNVHCSPWVSWDYNTNSAVGGPSAEWIGLFWKTVTNLTGDLSVFSEWPLIPAFLGRPILCRVKDHNLVFIPPISESSLEEEIPNLGLSDNYEGNESMRSYSAAFEKTKERYPWLLSLLNQCNVPIYDESFLNLGIPGAFLPKIGLSLGQVVISKLLASKRAGYFSEPVSFSDANRDELFNLFASDFSSSSSPMYTREELEVLRTLPIFKTVKGTYTRLHGLDQCVISPSAFFQPSDERCLSNPVDARGLLLFRALGIPELHDQEILVKFALRGFSEKTQAEKEDILIYLYMNWQDLQLNSAVISALKETNFVRNADESSLELFKPKDLFDPCDSLLMLVFSGELYNFPGERFIADGWLQILRKTGLRTSSEPEVILKCAKKVELLGKEAMKHMDDREDFDIDFSDSQNGISDEIYSASESVVEAILTNFAVLYSNSFCHELSKISFLPARKGLLPFGGKKSGTRVLTSYSEAILLKDWPLAWSCAPILARQNIVPPEYSWGAFHLRSPPAFSTVLKHIKIIGRNGGEDTLMHWPTSSGLMSIEEASCEILKYLDKTWGSLSASAISELQKVALIPVANGTRFVTAQSLFVRLSINLAPFAFELPTLYLPFVKILKQIGLQDVLSVSCAKDLLLNIQRSCGYHRLNPNELRAVLEILQFVCVDDTQLRSLESNWGMEAVVPDDGCRLVVARSCVYIDTKGSQFIRNVDISRLRFTHPSLPEKICTVLGISKLSDVVVEELDQENEIQVLDQIGPIFVQSIKEKLLSSNFQASLLAVISGMKDSSDKLEQLSLDEIQSLLVSIVGKIHFVQSLHTRFLLLPKSLDITRIRRKSGVPEWEKDLGHRTLYFIDRYGSRILVAEPPSYISIFDIIAIVVSRMLGFSAVLPIGALLSAPEGSEEDILNTLKLRSAGAHEIGVGGRAGLVGKEILPQDALQVQFHPLRPFYRGEIVAWRLEKEGEKLKYGCIPEDVRPSASQALYRFRVEIGPGEMQALLSSQVFSFRSISSAEVVSTSNLPDGGQTHMESQNNMQVAKCVGSSQVLSKSAKELQYGRVSSEELVQAVRDMLSAAGINMDAEKQTLLHTTLSLQEQLKETQTALLLEQEKAETATKEADAAKAAWSCRICLSAEVNVSIVPCGHVMCHRCSSAVTRCPFCRTQVSKTMKIFRP
ncbi:hypothetical protein H6P81_017792 [Aristolochia fimbriata]|uniref:RING-type domain-containing protein n=1 Tax=Aristolochia fimbriata TaxID=158543 RepID=A0AAV7DZL8_ARIFI|nr:hypothetical protein H6P81_017792 [Aristolochia fimbriata]